MAEPIAGEQKDTEVLRRIKIKYLVNDLIRVEKFAIGDWVDLRAAKDVELKAGEYKQIPLGVCMELPKGFEAHVVPRSSTFKRYHIIQTNSEGIIDHSYCGPNDEWQMPVYAVQDTVIHKNDRICQFRIFPVQIPVMFEEVNELDNPDRHGFGSTGSN